VALTFFRRLSPRPLGAAVALLLAAGCKDGTGPDPVVPAKPTFTVPSDALAALDCTANVAGATVSCSPVANSAAHVQFSAANVTSAGGVFGFDAAVKNLLVFKLGTTGGTPAEGIQVYLAAGPTASGGTGAVDARNGQARTVEGKQQAFFQYGQVLALNETASQRWEFTVASKVTAFTFRVYVQAAKLPVVLFDRVVGGNRDLYRVALDGSDLVRLTTNGAEDMNPTSGGGTVVFTSFRNGNAELYSMPLVGGAETRLTTTAAFETEPALNREGTRLAYSYDASGVSKVFVAAANGTGATRAASNNFGFGGAPEASPAWFPGADRLALVGTANGTADVFDLAAPGGMPSLLRGGESAEVTPAFSPDGKFLSYSSTAPGNAELFVLTLASGAVTRLTDRAGSDASGTWTPDGCIVYLAYTATGNELRWVNPAGGASGLILSGGASATPVLRPFAVPF
jgi:TolB protein